MLQFWFVPQGGAFTPNVSIQCVTVALFGTLNPKPSQKPSGMKEHIEQD